MRSNVVQLSDRRPSAGMDPLECVCGGQWFDLVMDEGKSGAVTLALDGSVTGYAGVPVCRECGRNAR